MFLFEYEKYFSEYVKNARKISIRTYRPKIDKSNFELSLEKAMENYDLIFDRSGLLLHSYTIETQEILRTIFTYDSDNRPIFILSHNIKNNILVSTSEFVYNDDSKIEQEIINSYHYNPTTVSVREWLYKYGDNTKTLTMIDSDYEGECCCESFLDDNGLELESKTFRNKTEFLDWEKIVYDEIGKRIAAISLNNDGTTSGIYKFKYEGHLLKSMEYQSQKETYIREFVYSLNDKGHVIHETTLADGEPKWYKEKTIEYYSD